MDESQIIDYLNNHCSIEEQRAVESWIAASVDHETLFLQIKQIWESERTMKQPPTPNVDVAWKKVHARIEKQGKRVSRRLMRVAAAISLMIIGATGIYYFLAPTPLEVFAVDRSEAPKMVELVDGSKVWLNAESQLFFPDRFKAGERRVKLIGQAYFEVAESAEHPFIIEAGETAIQVLGTTFDVMAYPDSSICEVLVESGRVAFYHSADQRQRLVLEKGETGRYEKAQNRLIKEKGVDVNKRAWYTNTLRFEDATLQEVAKIIEMTFDVRMEWEHPNIGNCLINASFPADDLDNLLTVIADLYDLELTADENGVFVLKGDGCE